LVRITIGVLVIALIDFYIVCEINLTENATEKKANDDESVLT
jgi:hypothetical protein